ncbi:hypothetical protein GCM10027566_01420 [Arachidicoccus ginsenosidivorans]|jgi:hypothetical protein
MNNLKKIINGHHIWKDRHLSVDGIYNQSKPIVFMKCKTQIKNLGAGQILCGSKNTSYTIQ